MADIYPNLPLEPAQRVIALRKRLMRRRRLLDENALAGLKAILAGYDVEAVPDMGWAGISNGRLLDAAQTAGFGILITADRNIRRQQNMAGRTIALVVLTTNHWLTVKAGAAAIAVACDRAGEGTYTIVGLARPSRLRRAPSVERRSVGANRADQISVLMTTPRDPIYPGYRHPAAISKYPPVKPGALGF